MNRDALADELNLLLTMEARGLGQHLREATPYLTAATYPVWREIRHMLDANAGHAQRLTELLASLELPERLRPFDPVVAGYHYSDLSYLLPLLIEEKRKQVAAYQRAIEHCGSDREVENVVAELRKLLGENQSQLDRLEVHHRKIAAGSALAERG